MGITKTNSLCLCMVLWLSVPSQDKGWRGIVPLHSTRADVERLVGLPVEPGGVKYKLETEDVFIEYSGDPCRKDRPGGYNVPRDTVVQIRVSPNTRPNFSTLPIHEGRYEQTRDPELPGVFYYTSREDGVGYEVQDGKVTTVTYFPAARDSGLRCPEARPRQSAVFASGELTTEGKELLDSFMGRLGQEPNVTGWIKINLEGKRVEEAEVLAERVCRYLRKNHPMTFERVTIIEDSRLGRDMELYIKRSGEELTPFPQ